MRHHAPPFVTALAAAALLLPRCAAAQNDLVVLNDEFENAATLDDWWRRYAVEGWPADQLELWDVDGTQPGRMVLMPHTVTWYGDYEGPLTFKVVTGDVVITTEVHATSRDGEGAPARDYSLAGIMIRRPRTDDASSWIAGQENYVFFSVGRGTAPGYSYETKSTVNSNSTLILDSAPGGDVTLQAARVGPALILLRREPAGPWVVHRRYARPDLPATLQVGLVAYTDWPNVSPVPPYTHNSTVLAGSPDLIAGFDYARFRRPVVPPELAGLDLTNPGEVSDAQLLSFLGDHVDDPVAVEAGPAPGPALSIQVLPNPCAGNLRIRFRLPAAGPARVSILDANGRRVADLGRTELAAGPHEQVWDGADERGIRVRPGVYLAMLETVTGRAAARICRLD